MHWLGLVEAGREAQEEVVGRAGRGLGGVLWVFPDRSVCMLGRCERERVRAVGWMGAGRQGAGGLVVKPKVVDYRLLLRISGDGE